MGAEVTFCCPDFKEASEGLLTNTKEGEYDQKVEQLDGWYIMGRPYDSWYGHFGRGERFDFCPWCGARLG